MALRTLWSNLRTVLGEVLEGLGHRLSHFFRKRRTAPVAKERAERAERWARTCEAILSQSHSDLVQGTLPEATDIQRSYHLHLVAEQARLGTAGSATMMHNSAVGRASHISGWAAHFMPVHEFEEFYVDTMFLNVGSSVEAMMHAWRAVAHFRDFPRLVAYQTRCLAEHHLGGLKTRRRAKSPWRRPERSSRQGSKTTCRRAGWRPRHSRPGMPARMQTWRIAFSSNSSNPKPGRQDRNSLPRHFTTNTWQKSGYTDGAPISCVTDRA